MTDLMSVAHLYMQTANVPSQPIIHTLETGVPMLNAVISSAVAFLVGGGLGWYIKGRGVTGVQNDLSNIKTDITNLKAKVGA